MFVGRRKELEFLQELYQSNKFEMLIMHGRRRVGKSYLISRFANNHIETKNGNLNLDGFAFSDHEPAYLEFKLN